MQMAWNNIDFDPAPGVPIIDKKRNRVKWTTDEDTLLERVAREMRFDWKQISLMLPGKSASQVEKRWSSRHNPDVSHEKWSPEEDRVIEILYRLFGGKWKKISKNLPGRTSDAIKNRFYSVIKRNNQKTTVEAWANFLSLDTDTEPSVSQTSESDETSSLKS